MMQYSAFVLLMIYQEIHHITILCYHFHKGEIFPIFGGTSALKSIQGTLLGKQAFLLLMRPPFFPPGHSFAISFRAQTF